MGSTALDDGAIDNLLGGADEDWLVYDFVQDDALDFTPGVDIHTNL